VSHRNKRRGAARERRVRGPRSLAACRGRAVLRTLTRAGSWQPVARCISADKRARSGGIGQPAHHSGTIAIARFGRKGKPVLLSIIFDKSFEPASLSIVSTAFRVRIRPSDARVGPSVSPLSRTHAHSIMQLPILSPRSMCLWGRLPQVSCFPQSPPPALGIRLTRFSSHKRTSWPADGRQPRSAQRVRSSRGPRTSRRPSFLHVSVRTFLPGNTPEYQTHSTSVVARPETIVNDLSVERPVWPLSVYGPAKGEPNLIDNTDVSPEELRLKFWEAKQANDPSLYVGLSAVLPSVFCVCLC
jgi:hypothetical protein